MPWVVLVAILAATPLDEARKQVRSLEYAKAARTLKVVEKAERLSFEEVVSFYELKGVVAASLGDAGGAKEAFTVLLTLAPGFRFPGRVSPKITTPFFEAKAVAKEEPLKLVYLQAVGPQDARELRFSLTAPEGLVRSVRVVISEDGVSRTEQRPAAPVVEVKASGAKVRAVAVALDERGWALCEGVIGEVESRPEAPPTPDAPLATAEPVRPPTVVAPSPPTEPPLALTRAVPEPRFRPAAWTLVGLGGASLVAGVVLGVLSSSARSTFESSTTLTRAEALALDRQARGTAVGANVAFVSAGVLAAAGVLLFILGAPSDADAVAQLVPHTSWSAFTR